MRRSASALLACALAPLCLVVFAQETKPRADAAISGVVIDDTTKQPITDAIVSLGAMSGPNDFSRATNHQLSDRQGRFVFTGLAAGRGYTVRASKTGYFDALYGGSSFLPIAVADGEWVRDVTVALKRPGAISGRVIDERGEPVIGIYVRVLGVIQVAGHDRYAVGPLATTDDRGMYRVGRLPPGRYVAMVPSVRASVPASASNATLAGMTEQVEAAVRAAGRGIRPSDPMMDVDMTTRVAVGGYPIPPPPLNGRAFTYPMAFSGGSTLAQSTPIILEPGTERGGLDIRLEPQPAVRISGVVQGPAEALSGLSLRLLAEGAEELGIGGEAGTALVAPSGAFTFAGVPAGTYTIEASTLISSYTIGSSSLTMFYGAQLPRTPGVSGTSTIGGMFPDVEGAGFSTTTLNGRKYWSRMIITAGTQGLENVTVNMRPTISISGRLVGDADPSQPAPAEAPRFVHLETATGTAWLGVPRSVSNRTPPAGEFVIDNVLPGRYHFRSDTQPWHIKSVIVNGRDHTYTPLDTSTGESLSGVVVTFTNALQSLAGTVTDAAGVPASGATVLVFPVEPEQWVDYGINPPRIKSMRTPASGAYRFKPLPAGDYYVGALPASQSEASQAPGFFQRVRAVATRFTLATGETKTLAVKLTELR